MHSHPCNRPTLFDPESGIELHRHLDLWFDDGSVVCRAENTLFRVHMSQLARHSICFRDMFSLGNHSDSPTGSSIRSQTGTNEFENCPVIVLHDSAEDVGNLFTALYDGPNFGDNDQEDFRRVSGVLRLSTKYIIDSLREKAIAHLSIAWPSTLKAWDLREDLARVYEMKTGSSGGHLYPSPIALINLAREVDAPSLLPSAFYDLCRYPYSQIYEPACDDPLYFPSSTMSDSPAASPQPPTPACLSLSDTQRLCLGKECAQHAITYLIQSMGNSQSIRNNGVHLQSAFSLTHPLAHVHPIPGVTGTAVATNSHHAGAAGSSHYNHHSNQHHNRRSSSTLICISAAACRKDFSELVDLATQHYLFDRERGYCDPLYVAEELGQLKSAEFSNSDSPECKACARSLEMWAAKERERLWRMIPTWFRLGSESSSSVSSPERVASPPVVDIVV